MATIDDMNDQLDVTTKLNSVIERMAKSAERVQESFQTQVDIVGRLTTAMNELNADKTVDSINKLSMAVRDLVDRLKDTAKVTNSSMGEVAKNAAEATKSTTNLGTTTEQFAKTLKDINAAGYKSISDTTKHLVANTNKYMPLIDRIKKFFGNFPKTVIVASAALNGFVQGLRNVAALSKSMLGFLGSIGSGALSVAASIASIPLKMFTGLVDLAANANTGMSELLQAMENLRKEMGDFKGPASSAVLSTTKTLKGFSDTGLSTWRVFGNLAERLELVTKVAVAMGSTFGVLRHEFEMNGGAILAFQKGLGVSDEQMKALGDRAITMGEPLSQVLLDTTKQTIGLGKAFDIDQKLIGKDIAKAIQDVKHFGSVTVKEIGQASVYARKLGVELDKIVGTLDAFETFDQAAENASKLSQSFGVTVDAFQMMEAQNPAEQIEMLRKQFAGAGVDASTFTRQQLKLISSSTGLDEATAKQVFSLKNAGVGLDDVKKKSESAAKKQMTQAEAMKALADSIERLVKQGMQQTGSFIDMFLKGIMGGLQSSREFYGIIWNIKRALQSVYMIGIQLGRLLPKIVPGLGDYLKGLKSFFDPKKFTTLFGGISSAAKEFFDPKSKKKGSIPALMNSLQERFSNFFTSQGPAAKQIIKGFQDMMRFLGKAAASGIKWAADQIRTGLTDIVDLITGKKKLGVPGGIGSGLGFLVEVFSPIIDSLKDAWKQLYPVLSELVRVSFEKLKVFVKSEKFLSTVKKVVPYIATALFGPALVRTGLSVLGTTMVKGLGGGSGALGKILSSGLMKVLGPIGIGAALAGASISIGKSIRELKSQIVGDFEDADKTIGAAATGVLDAITFGLLPDSLKPLVANVMATLSQSFFDGLKGIFGKGFTSSLKDLLGSQLDVVGKFGDVLSSLFSGNEDAFLDASAALAKSIVLMGGDAMELSLQQLPLLIAKWAIELTGFMQRTLFKSIAGLADYVGEKLGGSFGQVFKNAASALREGADTNKKLVEEAVAKDEELAKKSMEIHKRHRDMVARQMGVSQDIVKEAKKAASEQSAAMQMPEAEAANFGIREQDDAGITSIAKKVKTIEDFQKRLSSGKFDIKKLTADINSTFKEDAVKPALTAINNMVKLVNDLNTALSDADLNKVDVKTKLQNVANAVGLGGKASYTIQNKPVNITVNLQVTMDAEDLEKSLIMRTKSIIRERLNFATNTPNAQGTPEIPDKVGPYVPVNSQTL